MELLTLTFILFISTLIIAVVLFVNNKMLKYELEEYEMSLKQVEAERDSYQQQCEVVSQHHDNFVDQMVKHGLEETRKVYYIPRLDAIVEKVEMQELGVL